MSVEFMNYESLLKPLLPLLRLSKRPNVRGLLRFISILASLITIYSVLFQALMSYEGQPHSWVTGFYWTLSTMSTLGYGDISFTTDLGRMFSILVLLSGIIFMLVLLPFTFIELFYEPWMKARASSLLPRRVPDEISGHVVLTFYGPLASALISKLHQFKYPYVVILPIAEEVTGLVDQGINAICGELNDPQTYLNARVEHAALVATTRSDLENTSIVFTARGIAESTPIVSTARDHASVDVLKLAGCTRVLDLTHLMAEALARRAIGGKKATHIIGRIDDLVVAEVDAAKTSLVGQNYIDAQYQTSVSIVGFWDRGQFEVGQEESTIQAHSVLVLAGTVAQLNDFEIKYCASENGKDHGPVIIIGGGRVGRETAVALARRGIDYRIVERLQGKPINADKYILGSGTDKAVLLQAGIEAASTVIITTHEDEMNTYLTIFCRLLHPDLQVISRATLERSVAALHRAGADIVMSYASMGSTALFNLLQRSDLLMIAEGLDVFKVKVPHQLHGKTLADSNIRQVSGCTVIGIDENDVTTTHPGPMTVLSENSEIVLIGTPAGEREFLKRFEVDDEIASVSV